MRNTLDSNNITYTSVTVTSIYSASVAVGFLVDFSPEDNFQLVAVVSEIQFSGTFSGYSVQRAEVIIIESAGQSIKWYTHLYMYTVNVQIFVVTIFHRLNFCGD